MKHLLVTLSVLLSFLPVSAKAYLDLATASGQDEALWSRKGAAMSAACVYRSVDQHGDSITLSGRLFVPRVGRAKRIVVCPHYSITGNAECPSEGMPYEACLAETGHIVVMPDYQGYGVSVDRVHPYLCLELTVTQTLDMLRAATGFLERSRLMPEHEDIVLVGFSQGAAAAVGLLQRLEQTDAYDVAYCYAGSGPYDVATLFDLAVERNYIGMAFVVPAYELGTAAAYDIEVHPDTLFTPWMLERYAYVSSKEHNVLQSFMHLGKGKLSKYMSAAAMDKSYGEAAMLYAGYLRSSMVHIYGSDTIMSDWCPKTPIYMMHSTNDDLVNYECAANMQTMWNRNGATCVTYDFGKYGGHLRSLIRFFRYVKKELSK